MRPRRVYIHIYIYTSTHICMRIRNNNRKIQGPISVVCIQYAHTPRTTRAFWSDKETGVKLNIHDAEWCRVVFVCQTWSWSCLLERV